MKRVDYLQARIRQLSLAKLLPPRFSSWLARLESGDPLPIQPVFAKPRPAGRLLELLGAEIRSRR